MTREELSQGRIVHVTTVPDSLLFLAGQGTFMRERGWEMHVISTPGPLLDSFASVEGVTAHGVQMRRSVSPLADLVAVVKLVRCLRQLRPAVLHIHTPKAGLLAGLAGWAARVPKRIYHLHGLRFETATGGIRRVLFLSDRVSCRLAHRVLCVSPSLRDAAICAGVVGAQKAEVLLAGSINGVDAERRFLPDRWRDQAAELRTGFSIPFTAAVIGYIGRVVRDKGIVDLEAAWQRLSGVSESVHLVIVGQEEAFDPVPVEVMRRLRVDSRVHIVGHVAEPAPYYAMFDVFAFPTHREGFGLAALEASAMQVPVVASRVTGVVDAVMHDKSGRLVAVGDPDGLATAIECYLASPELRSRHGAAGRQRVLAEFRPESMWQAIAEQYEK